LEDFSNSDVLGSAPRLSSAFKQRKANVALKNFFKREDTLSVGTVVCSVYGIGIGKSEHEIHGKMHWLIHTNTKVFYIGEKCRNHSVTLSTLAGTAAWVGFHMVKLNCLMTKVSIIL
jgi:phosphoribosylformylglycinamidine synthase